MRSYKFESGCHFSEYYRDFEMRWILWKGMIHLFEDIEVETRIVIGDSGRLYIMQINPYQPDIIEIIDLGYLSDEEIEEFEQEISIEKYGFRLCYEVIRCIRLSRGIFNFRQSASSMSNFRRIFNLPGLVVRHGVFIDGLYTTIMKDGNGMKLVQYLPNNTVEIIRLR